jgi:hypothetical protein
MTYPMEYSSCIHRRGAMRAAVGDSMPRASTSLPRSQNGLSTRDASRAGSVSVREGSLGLYDAVDLRLMDTFPASDAVARY